MYCGNCGSPIKEKSQYCIACGSKFEPFELDGNRSRNAQVVQKRRMPFWYKLAAGVSFCALVAVAMGIWFTENLRSTIEQQLEALKAHDISRAYYAFTSKDFQEATPLEAFREYVNTYPVFSNVKSTKFDQRTVQKNIGILKGFLISEEGMETPIEYELIKDTGKWKISNIHLAADTPVAEPLQELAISKSDITLPIELQIRNIRKDDIENAYRQTTSTEFQSLTSLDAFKEFVKAYPLLASDADVDYGTPSLLDNFASLLVTLKKGDDVLTLEYNMILEHGKWKIWGVKGEASKAQ